MRQNINSDKNNIGWYKQSLLQINSLLPKPKLKIQKKPESTHILYEDVDGDSEID